MGGDANSWMLSDGLPAWRPLMSLQDDQLLAQMAWAKTGREYQAMVARYLEGRTSDINSQMDAWRKAERAHMSPTRTWRSSNRDRAAEAAQNLQDSEQIRAWWLDRVRSVAARLGEFGISRLEPATPPEFLPGTKPSADNRDRMAAFGRLRAQFAARYTPRTHTRLGPAEGSAFILEVVPGPARVVFVDHKLGSDPDPLTARDVPFPPFLMDVLGDGWNQVGGPKLELLPIHPETGKPLKERPGVTQFERNFLAHHQTVAVPRS